MASLLIVATLIGGVGLGAARYSHEQSDLVRLVADRASAQLTLERAISHAISDGLNSKALASVVSAEHAIIGESARPHQYRYFDDGELAHLATEAAALRALVGRVDHIEAVSTDISRIRAATLLDELDAAVVAEKAAGLDPAADATLAATARDSVAHAPSPLAVEVAVVGLNDRKVAIEQQTLAKVAADKAAAELAVSKGDASAALTRGDRLAQQAATFPQLHFEVDSAVLHEQHLGFEAAVSEAQFDAINGAVTEAADHIAALLSARSAAYGGMALARNAIETAIKDKVDTGTVPTQLDPIQTELDAAGTLPVFNALAAQIATLIAPILDRVGLAELGIGKVIVVNLDRQSLTAYQDGAVQFTTPITSGRPALPTPPGTYSVLRKNHPWTMTSDWPRSSPYWYPPSVVQYALWFTNDGYAIHDAPWRAYYGPGTNANGSHGCVNVPMPIMASIFGWADLGTRVIIK